MLKAMSNSKFNYKVNYYTYVLLSFEDKNMLIMIELILVV